MKYLMHIYLKVYKKTQPHLVLYFMNEKKKKKRPWEILQVFLRL